TTGTGAGSPASPVIAPEYEVVTVAVSAGAFRDSAECTPGSIVVGHHPVGDVDKEIESIRISADTLKVKLTGKGKQINTFNVILLKPVPEHELEVATEETVTVATGEATNATQGTE
ncbi:MAG: hypothetical protein J7K40_05970, partial [candidate division Zixibacteria bacterium]|nr:hypothetical protein [candidate division Zixibacteria bacterium]